MIEKWDKSYNRRKARDLIDRLVTAVRDPRDLDPMFDHFDKQPRDHLPKKVRLLEDTVSEIEKRKALRKTEAKNARSDVHERHL